MLKGRWARMLRNERLLEAGETTMLKYSLQYTRAATSKANFAQVVGAVTPKYPVMLPSAQRSA